MWSTAQYLSYAPTHSVLDLTVTLAAEGRRVTQGRVVGRVGDAEILTVNAAAGSPGDARSRRVSGSPRRTCRHPTSARRAVPPSSSASIFDRIDVRLATGRSFEEIRPGWECRASRPARFGRVCPATSSPSAATLAIIGDYVTGGVSQPLGRRAMSRSLDNTLRMVRLGPTEWVLCDIRIQALVGGYGQGIALPVVGARAPCWPRPASR